METANRGASTAVRYPPVMSTATPPRPSALTTCFVAADADRPSANITLYRGIVELVQRKHTVRGEAEITFGWLPSPRVDFRMPATRALEAFSMLRTVQVRIPEHGWRAPAFLTYLGFGRDATGTFIGSIGGGLKAHRQRRLHGVSFHIANYRRLGTEWVCHGTARWLGRTVLRAGGWEVTLDRIAGADKLLSDARRDGGFVITHVGCAKRADGNSFSTKDVEPLMEVLRLFLSFTCGAWTSPFLLVGTNHRGERVWEDWSPALVTSPRGEVAWAPDHVDVAAAFPGFWGLATDAKLGTALSSIVHWYVEANLQSGALEGAVVLLQCGFELLTWMELVMRRNLRTPTAFETLAAKEALTELLGVLRIPTAIPRSLPQLRARAKAANLPDGPAVLTAIRNRIVHPPKKGKALEHHGVPLIYEAWTYSIWLAELCVLAMIGYRGRYQDRIRQRRRYTDSTTVPWA